MFNYGVTEAMEVLLEVGENEAKDQLHTSLHGINKRSAEGQIFRGGREGSNRIFPNIYQSIQVGSVHHRYRSFRRVPYATIGTPKGQAGV